MPVSSLIFVVIVAIWAAYLVQHWVRRREDAAATRSVDGFTEAMRVLEKRPVLPSTELRTPRPHSYAVQPARVARPTVDVKRAVPAGASLRHSPLVARRAEKAAATLGRPDHDTALNAEVHRMPESARPCGSRSRPRRDERSAVPAAPRVPVGQRRLRAALLLAAVAWVPVSVVLTVTGVLPWYSVPFAAVTVVAVLAWLRAEAQADRRRAVEGDHRRSRRTDERPAPVRMEQAPSIDDTQVIRSTVSAETTAQPSQPSRPSSAPAASAGVFDVQAPVTGEVPVVTAAAGPLPEGSWSPVPVPLPTYTLKAKAEPRYTESGIPADVFDTPEFADEADELDDRALFARRAVSQ